MSVYNEYKERIAKATTKAELGDISYKAYLADDDALSGKKTLYDKVIELCIKREAELEGGLS